MDENLRYIASEQARRRPFELSGSARNTPTAASAQPSDRRVEAREHSIPEPQLGGPVGSSWAPPPPPPPNTAHQPPKAPPRWADGGQPQRSQYGMTYGFRESSAPTGTATPRDVSSAGDDEPGLPFVDLLAPPELSPRSENSYVSMQACSLLMKITETQEILLRSAVERDRGYSALLAIASVNAEQAAEVVKRAAEEVQNSANTTGKRKSVLQTLGSKFKKDKGDAGGGPSSLQSQLYGGQERTGVKDPSVLSDVRDLTDKAVKMRTQMCFSGDPVLTETMKPRDAELLRDLKVLCGDLGLQLTGVS